MKKIVALLTAGLLLATVLPVGAETAKTGKDECLLASKSCMHEVDTLQKQVKKLQAEVKKGTKTYTAEELQTLENKLKEVNEYIKSMNRPGK